MPGRSGVSVAAPRVSISVRIAKSVLGAMFRVVSPDRGWSSRPRGRTAMESRPDRAERGENRTEMRAASAPAESNFRSVRAGASVKLKIRRARSLPSPAEYGAANTALADLPSQVSRHNRAPTSILLVDKGTDLCSH